ncbi:hypothetical protein M0G74_03040 [Microbulbifer sp. CAU 1566]|uniref:hypothetical protein n=1 Tax=Microbulbifer sp. CAU 1566 TaxID=2933269 RepID=UPI0020036623|nr:hypothetical protein [Microbulbifer sp. CAU 1566]MCK7596241.1 hypothetical protein [Microbulbifer sp. CAU 1566]
MLPDRANLRPVLFWGLLWALLSVCFCGLAAWQSQRTLVQDISTQLDRQLPEKLALALQARLTDGDLGQWVSNRLEQDLQKITPTGGLPNVSSCSARVIQLIGDEGSAPGGNIQVSWHIGSEPRHTLLSLDCQYNWPLLIASQSLLALLLVMVIALLPRPLSRAQRARIAQLVQRGLPSGQAYSLSETLTDQQLQWFDCAMRANGGNTEQALVVAATDNRLEFNCTSLQVRVHGVVVKLSKTPFFYYLWYALQRQGDEREGWFLNPPVNRPDRAAAESLIEWMEAHGGHNKSINDLKENGLRAKTLDQNRNKIRDELVSALGENLATSFLFESERDLKSGRYRHRLSLGSSQIEVVTD